MRQKGEGYGVREKRLVICNMYGSVPFFIRSVFIRNIIYTVPTIYCK